jgi:cation transport regulator
LATYNSIWAEYKSPEDRLEHESREEVAHKAAWEAVKEEFYEKDDGKWIKRDME